jgi:hypothetical protein
LQIPCPETIFDQERFCLYNAFGNPDLPSSILSPAEINAIDVVWWVLGCPANSITES